LVGGFIQTGRELMAAKGRLEHGEWLKMIAGELPFQKRIAQYLMAIARDPFLQKRSNASLLPPDYASHC
jgi:hypothetical protein